MRPRRLCDQITTIVRDLDYLFTQLDEPFTEVLTSGRQTFSYPAAQALWHLLGAMRSSWTAASVHHEGLKRYFLRGREDLFVLDPTRFECDSRPRYDFATVEPFLTSTPCGRAHKIIERAGYLWPLDEGESVCDFCAGTGERIALRCECCYRPAVCIHCGGSGISHQFPAKVIISV